MISINQLRDVVANYIAHRDLERFVREFSPLSFDIRQRGDSDAAALAKGVEATLAELHVGHLNRDSVRARLADLLIVRRADFNFAVKVQSQSSSATSNADASSVSFPRIEVCA
jgi:hypothetical protein